MEIKYHSKFTWINLDKFPGKFSWIESFSCRCLSKKNWTAGTKILNAFQINKKNE